MWSASLVAFVRCPSQSTFYTVNPVPWLHPVLQPLRRQPGYGVHSAGIGALPFAGYRRVPFHGTDGGFLWYGVNLMPRLGERDLVSLSLSAI